MKVSRLSLSPSNSRGRVSQRRVHTRHEGMKVNRGLGLGWLIGGLSVAVGCSTAGSLDGPAARPSAALAAPASTPIPKTAKASVTAPASAAPRVEPPIPAPAYDLGADIEVRRRQAIDDLGPRTDVQLVETTFVVAAPGGRGSLASAVDVTRHALEAYFNGRFSKRPERAISVYLFPNAGPYEAYCKKHDSAPCISPFGYYEHGDRHIIMNVGPGIGTLTHELIHPLVETDFPKAPDWINEGIASLFEHFYFSAPGEIHGGKNWRHPRLVQALRSEKERHYSSVPSIFALSDEEFRGEREDLNYASARFLCQWLDQKHLLWPFYQRWRDNYADDPSGSKSFEAVVGKTLAEADTEWSTWVLRL